MRDDSPQLALEGSYAINLARHDAGDPEACTLPAVVVLGHPGLEAKDASLEVDLGPSQGQHFALRTPAERVRDGRPRRTRATN
jgi:hypothetical protein